MAEGFLQGLFDLLGMSGTPEPKQVNTPSEAMPTAADVDRALRYGYGYAQSFEPFVQGQEVRDVGHPRGTIADVTAQIEKTPVTQVPSSVAPGGVDKSKYLADAYTKMALLSSRSALASIGFDPKTFGVELGDRKTTLGGYYDKKRDVGYANLGDRDALFHESIHRGINKLRDAGLLSKDENSFFERNGRRCSSVYCGQTYG